jgi:hypothetical protein
VFLNRIAPSSKHILPYSNASSDHSAGSLALAECLFTIHPRTFLLLLGDSQFLNFEIIYDKDPNLKIGAFGINLEKQGILDECDSKV